MKKIQPYIPGILLFVLALIIGLFVYRDYGISWDEPFQRTIGMVNYNYIFNHDTALLTFPDKQYGPAFELPLILKEKWMHMSDTREIYFIRHLATHVFFLIGAFCAYVLALRLFRNQFVACLGFVMIAFMPRIYAHSFFNTKDVPFLSALIICTMLCQVAFDKKNLSLFLLLGMACGVSAGIRMMALLPSVIILGFLVIDVIAAAIRKEEPGRKIGAMALFVGGFCICLYTVFPYLWSDPLHHFADVVSRMFRKDFCGFDLVNGKLESSLKLPWYYLPEWFCITIPALWLICGLLGIIWLITVAIKDPATFLGNTRQRNFVLCLLCFLVPVMSVIAFKSVIYDEWRHLYFIYPFFVFIALFFIDRLVRTGLKRLVQLGCIVQVISVGSFMIRNHPFQQVYFNGFVSHDKQYLRRNFEFDYWGASAKQALEYLVTTHPDGIIKVSSPVFANYVTNNCMILKPQDRDRVQIVDKDQADYYITNFRADHLYYDQQEVVYERKVLNSSIICVYKIHR